jgi:hypothetical protein
MDTSTPSYRVGVISMIQEEEDAILACFSAFFGDFELGRLTKFNDFPFRIYRPTTEFCPSGTPLSCYTSTSTLSGMLMPPISRLRPSWRSLSQTSGTCSMLSAMRGRAPQTWRWGVVPNHVHAVWIVVSEVQHAPTVPASCRRNLRRLLWRRRLSRAARALVAGLRQYHPHRLPPDMCVKKTAPRLPCPAASRRRTAPSSCGAAGGDALNAVGHFVVVYRPTAYT